MTRSGFTVNPREIERLRARLVDDPRNQALRASLAWWLRFCRKVERDRLTAGVVESTNNQTRPKGRGETKG